MEESRGRVAPGSQGQASSSPSEHRSTGNGGRVMAAFPVGVAEPKGLQTRSRTRAQQVLREWEGGGKSLWITSERVVFKVLVKWPCRDTACWVLCFRPRDIPVSRDKVVKTNSLGENRVIKMFLLGSRGQN